MKNQKLRDAFTYWRRKNPRGTAYDGAGRSAIAALERARADVAANVSRYPSAINRGAQLGAAMADGAQWGNPDALGLRFVGWQDELRTRTRDTHSGWFTQPDGWDGEVYRGCVYQLPARNGRARYVPAYREGSTGRKKNDWSDTCGEHSAALDFSNVMHGTRGENTSRYDTADTLLDAARAADSLAESAAEKAREYNEAWQAGQSYRDKRDELKETRGELRALVRELKAARTHSPAICRALRETVSDMRAEMRAAYKETERLKDAVWRDYYPAFNDGAGETVLA